MIRGLAIVALGGAAISALCISASGAISARSWHIPGLDWTFQADDHDAEVSSPTSGSRPGDISRDLAWSGGEALAFDVPATITYTPGPQPHIAVYGPSNVVDALSVDDGAIGFSGTSHNVHYSHDLAIAVTAPNLHDFTLRSAQKLQIRDISTEKLTIEIDGAGVVEASGRARALDLTLNGVGNADMAPLALQDAEVSINGVGHAKLGATGNVSVTINGAGAVTLTRRPKTLNQDIEGAGTISQPPAP